MICYSPPKANGDVLAVIPYDLLENVLGGCDCPYCKNYPAEVPQWDALNITNPSEVFVVHWPGLRDDGLGFTVPPTPEQRLAFNAWCNRRRHTTGGST